MKKFLLSFMLFLGILNPLPTFASEHNRPHPTGQMNFSAMVDALYVAYIFLRNYSPYLSLEAPPSQAPNIHNVENSENFSSFHNRHEEEFFRRTAKTEWTSVINHIIQFPHHFTEGELEALHLRNWKHPIFKKFSYPYQVLQAYLSKKISLEETCMLFLYESCLNQVSEETFVMGHFQSESEYFRRYQLIRQSGGFDEKALKVFVSSIRDFLTEEERALFLLSISEWTPESTQFFAVKGRDSFLEAFLGDGQNEFIYLENGFIWQIIPSPNLAFHVFRARAGDNAIGQIPAIGYSERERFSDTTQRVIFIPCSLFPFATHSEKRREHYKSIGARSRNSETVHGFSTWPLTVYHHDLYHHMLDSLNPHRPIWVSFSRHMRGRGHINFSNRLLDREFRQYQNRHASEKNFGAALFALTFLKKRVKEVEIDGEAYLDVMFAFCFSAKLPENFDIHNFVSSFLRLPQIREEDKEAIARSYALHRNDLASANLEDTKN